MSLDKEVSKKLFENILTIWVRPEMDKRVKNGQITNDFVLDRAQILIPPDKIPPEIRLNKEVKARITGTFKGNHKEPGEYIYESELGDEIHNIELTDDDPNFGHITMLLFKGRWVIHFDSRVNKARAKERYEAAKEFYEVAKICHDNKYWRAFIDNLYSSAELLVTSQLMVLSLLPTKTNKPKHDSIQYQYNLFINRGNAKLEHKEIFNKLSGLRHPGRYLKQQFKLTPDETGKMLQVVDDIFKFTDKVIT